MAEQQDGRGLGPDLMMCHTKPGPPTRLFEEKKKKEASGWRKPLISGLKAIFKVKITLKIS